MAGGMIAMDVLTLLVAVLVYGASTRAAIETYRRTEPALGVLLSAVLATLVFLVSLLITVALLHRILPKPVAGRHKVMKGAAFWGWTLNFVLKRVIYFPPLKSIFYSSNILRYLSLRALGCDISFTANMSIDAEVLDPYLTKIGPGATIGARALISSHYFEGDQLNLAPVVIGKGVLLSVMTLVGPGCVVGDGAKVLGGSSLTLFCTVGANASIQPDCYFGTKAVVEAGEVVPVRTMRMRPDAKPKSS